MGSDTVETVPSLFRFDVVRQTILCKNDLSINRSFRFPNTFLCCAKAPCIPTKSIEMIIPSHTHEISMVVSFFLRVFRRHSLLTSLGTMIFFIR